LDTGHLVGNAGKDFTQQVSSPPQTDLDRDSNWVLVSQGDSFHGLVILSTVLDLGVWPAALVDERGDEADVYGDAVQVVIFSCDTSEKIQDSLLLDARSLCTEVTIPTKKSNIFSADANNQTSVLIHVREREEHVCTRDRNHLGRFGLFGIPPHPRGIPQIKITFHINTNGTLGVSASKTNRKVGSHQGPSFQCDRANG